MRGDTLFSDAYLNRGLVYIELNEYEKALADIKLIESSKPRKRYLRHYLEGIIYARQGGMQKARASFDKAIRMKQDFALLYTWRGLVLSELAQDQAALDDFLRSLELDPTQTILYVNISHLYFNLQDYNNALGSARKAKAAGEVVDAKYMDELLELTAAKQH